MEALQLTTRGRLHPYVCQSIEVRPNPPKVGVPTVLALALANSGPEPLTVSRVSFKVSQFGMGAHWEELPPLGPFQVPADSMHCEVVQQEWTPTTGGHRCVQAMIQVESLPRPIYAQRNLSVIQSSAERSGWQVPFTLGNPEEKRLPLTLRVEQQGAQVGTALVVNGHVVRVGEPIWLDPHEEVEAYLLLRALTAAPIASEHAVEAFLDGRFLDGIRVALQRPALRRFLPEEGQPGAVLVEQEALALVR
ncbi:MAG TPA: hypothetical protein VKT82_06540 [Ktedonobacterales bacterium]|nr:hypothetical protein [Ktedonobacterales bacterium]